jgi:hypothetical protein
VGGGVQLGPLGTAATNRPIVPAPGDYGDGEIVGMIGRETEVLRENLPQDFFLTFRVTCRFTNTDYNLIRMTPTPKLLRISEGLLY